MAGTCASVSCCYSFSEFHFHRAPVALLFNREEKFVSGKKPQVDISSATIIHGRITRSTNPGGCRSGIRSSVGLCRPHRGSGLCHPRTGIVHLREFVGAQRLRGSESISIFYCFVESESPWSDDSQPHASDSQPSTILSVVYSIGVRRPDARLR